MNAKTYIPNYNKYLIINRNLSHIKCKMLIKLNYFDSIFMVFLIHIYL